MQTGDRLQIGRSFDYTFFEVQPTADSRVEDLLRGGRSVSAAMTGELAADLPSGNEGLWISPSAVVWRNGAVLPVALSRTEYRLIKTLAARPGEICDYDSVVRAVWGDPKNKASLHELIFRVRRKIEIDAALPQYLIIRSGIGVVFFPHGEASQVE